MPQARWTEKRERQYKHIKDSLLERGKGEKTGRGNRRAHRQQGPRPARREQDGEPDLARRHLAGAARRPALAPRRRRPDLRAALRGGGQGERQGPLEDDQGRARARRRALKLPTRSRAAAVAGEPDCARQRPVDRLAACWMPDARARRSARAARPRSSRCVAGLASGVRIGAGRRPGAGPRARARARHSAAGSRAAPDRGQKSERLAPVEITGGRPNDVQERAQLDHRQDHRRPRGDRSLRRLDPRRRPEAPARRHDPGPAGAGRRDPPARPGQRLHPDPARRRARAAGLLARFADARPDRADRDPARADGRDRRARDRRHDQHHHARRLHAAVNDVRLAAATRTASCSRRRRGRATSPQASSSSTTR